MVEKMFCVNSNDELDCTNYGGYAGSSNDVIKCRNCDENSKETRPKPKLRKCELDCTGEGLSCGGGIINTEVNINGYCYCSNSPNEILKCKKYGGFSPLNLMSHKIKCLNCDENSIESTEKTTKTPTKPKPKLGKCELSCSPGKPLCQFSSCNGDRCKGYCYCKGSTRQRLDCEEHDDFDNIAYGIFQFSGEISVATTNIKCRKCNENSKPKTTAKPKPKPKTTAKPKPKPRTTTKPKPKPPKPTTKPKPKPPKPTTKPQTKYSRNLEDKTCPKGMQLDEVEWVTNNGYKKCPEKGPCDLDGKNPGCSCRFYCSNQNDNEAWRGNCGKKSCDKSMQGMDVFRLFSDVKTRCCPNFPNPKEPTEKETEVICNYIEGLEVVTEDNDGRDLIKHNGYRRRDCGRQCRVHYTKKGSGSGSKTFRDVCTGCKNGELKILQNLREGKKLCHIIFHKFFIIFPC